MTVSTSGSATGPLLVELMPTFPSEVSSSAESSVSSADEVTIAPARGRTGILVRSGSRTRSRSVPPPQHHIDHFESTEEAHSLPASTVDSLQSSPETSTSYLKLNVKFAPLPEMPVNRKRRNATPLGVSSRSQLMRRRRQLSTTTVSVQNTGDSNPVQWSHQEVEAQLRLQQSAVQIRNVNKSPGDEIEDPLLLFGRKIKGALKRVAKGKEKERLAVIDATQAPDYIPGERRIVLATVEAAEGDNVSEEEGRVWEEEVGEKFSNLRIQGDTGPSKANGNHPNEKYSYSNT